MASNPNPIDVHVGKRLRLRRTLLGMSQERLGELLGLTFQQVQKYERGANRIGSSRLFELGQILDVPVSFFFEGLSGEQIGISGQGDILTDKEALVLVRAYYTIPETQRRRLFDLARVLSEAA